MRIKTGSPGLDKLLEGGLPSQSSVLLYGSPGVGKSTFAINFLYEGLKNGEKCIYVNTVDSTKALFEKTKLNKIDLTPYKKNLIIIDAYTCKSSKKSSEKYYVNSLANIMELNIEVKKAIEETNFKNGRIVIDSLSDFLLYGEKKSIYKFLQILRSRVVETDSVALILVEEGLHDEHVISTLSFLTDGTIKMQLLGNKRGIRIERMVNTHHSLKWAEFEIKPDTQIYVREFFK